MVFAGVIASIAIITNNPILIVGAMIVSPDYGPMAALSFTLLIVNLVGLLAGGLLTLLLTRAWARRIEGGRALFRPKSARGI